MASEAVTKALKVVVFLGTTRENNMGSRAAKFIVNKLSSRGYAVNLFDPVVLDLPLLIKPLHFYKDRSQAPQVLQEKNKLIVEADAFVFVTAEYNHCLPPALTNMVDHFPCSSFKYRPASIVCYSMGSVGGQRAAMQARCFLGELGCPSTSFIFSIPEIQKQLNEDGTPIGDRMNSGADKLINELAWYANGIRDHTEKVAPPV